MVKSYLSLILRIVGQAALLGIVLVLLTASAQPEDALSALLEDVFPGGRQVEIDGSLVDSSLTPDHLDNFGNIQQGYTPRDDRAPWAIPMYTVVSASDPSAPEQAFPVRIDIILAGNLPERLETLSVEEAEATADRDRTDPFVGVEVTAYRGERPSDHEYFLLNPDGRAVFDWVEVGLALEWRTAFDFTIENQAGDTVHVRGAFRVVDLNYHEYDDLPEESATFAAISGAAYVVTDEGTVIVEREQSSIQVRIETPVSLPDAPEETVTVEIEYRIAIQENSDSTVDFSTQEVTEASFTLDGEPLEDFELSPETYLYFIQESDETNRFSGQANLVWVNGLDYIRLDLLFRNVMVS